MSKKDHYRWLREAVAGSVTPLKVDAEAGIIYGVKILGRYSPNCHGILGVTEGTEYTVDCMQAARGLYEGATVYTNHDREAGDGARDVNDTFGVLKNVRVENDCIRGDLHYLKTNPLAARVVEDVTRGLGVYGLSHNAYPAKAVVREAKYVIDRLESVRSVDLVDKPATNKNLAESRENTMKRTFKAILTEAIKGKSAVRQKIANRLMEMDGMDDAMGTEVETPDTASPEDALKDGFRSAINAILDDDSMDAAAKVAKIKTLLTTHEKLTSESEPMDDTTADDKPDDKDKATTEAIAAMKRKIKDFESKEAIRNLCEAENFKPSATQMKALLLLESEADRKALIAESKAIASTHSEKPRSSGPLPKKTDDGKGPQLQESTTAKDFAAMIRG